MHEILSVESEICKVKSIIKLTVISETFTVGHC